MAINYIALKTELTTDPRSYGYSTPWASGEDWKLADLINQVRNTINIDRDLIDAHEIFECIVPAEWTTISAQEKERVQVILSMGQINTKGANTRAAFQVAFAAGTTTRANLAALLSRKGSRAEELFGTGISISWDDIAKARRT